MNTECLPENDIHSFSPSISFDECKEWCSSNSTCSGFIATHTTCYFKREDCRDHTEIVYGTTLYLKQGNQII